MVTQEQTDELKVRERGLSDGAAVGTWVIDGNTSDETCAEILRLMADCAWDGPELRLGEWADDPSFEEILSDIDIEIDEECPEATDDLFCTYSDAWYEGLQHEVERACLARVTPVVTDDNETNRE